jgi:hypothetical protein
MRQKSVAHQICSGEKGEAEHDENGVEVRRLKRFREDKLEKPAIDSR